MLFIVDAAFLSLPLWICFKQLKAENQNQGKKSENSMQRRNMVQERTKEQIKVSLEWSHTQIKITKFRD